ADAGTAAGREGAAAAGQGPVAAPAVGQGPEPRRAAETAPASTGSAPTGRKRGRLAIALSLIGRGFGVLFGGPIDDN
ncbi:MAG: hypothetical protein MSA61_08080, partial [Coriobacteriaceae bacterium]|nr:hypothetical protein [Coriobacteriaceae bacterium]